MVLSSGGGGVNCDPQPALFGSPAYATYEDDAIGGNVSITGWRSCWLGFFRESVSGNVAFNNILRGMQRVSGKTNHKEGNSDIDDQGGELVGKIRLCDVHDFVTCERPHQISLLR